eukprot:CAMPEP_0172554916 /NCGR_PEP_ID=MMETSP1067-20121228/57011_1 /TAXON_ID=265564 ORGANISM="Thalassiosira punctigera, Strain Tpunct2005C2" /NCGR_SAMPLE_ID=MMETSP1067 /ASSEMBLY_ACC=CAM_ASM_000444 /LENGTH=216 /DNA_ID=CAMNT_0013343385 /DNA_START=133 /DNA_END=783 /DNA_ORIENTATION=-
MKLLNVYSASAALGACVTPISAFGMPKPSPARTVNTPMDIASLSMIAGQSDSEPVSTRSRYKMDIDMLDQLLDSEEEEKLEEIRALIQDIQETRKNNPEVALPHKVREALADYRRAEAKYGRDSREAKIARAYFLDISNAEDMKPERYREKGDRSDVLDEAVNAVNVLEELKEIAHMEKSILDRFGSTDFEIGEGLLERGIGREDPDLINDYSLWP